MAFVSHTAKQWLAGHRKGISILRSIPPLVTPPLHLPLLLFIFSQHPFSSFTLFSLFLSLLLGLGFLCVMGLEALGPFVRTFHLNVAQIMLWVGSDAAPLWHSANGVCEDTAPSLLRCSLLLAYLLSLLPLLSSLADS